MTSTTPVLESYMLVSDFWGVEDVFSIFTL